jgi:Flp pilus assembly protein TadG
MRRGAFIKNEAGSVTVEVAMVALLFFTLIFGIIEFGRLLYTHNALTDATRRGARYASINKQADESKVIDYVVYGESVTYAEDGTTPTSPPLINGLTREMVQIEHAGVDLDGDPDTPGTTNYGSNLGTVTVSITGYTFSLNVPVIARPVTMPDYFTTTSAESAGEKPADIGP